MAEHLAYQTAKRKKQIIEFDVDAEKYHFTVPKSAAMILPVIDSDEDDGLVTLKAEYNWFSKGLGEGEADRLKARLEDDEDDFDWPDFDDVYKWVLKQVNGRPTT